MSTPLVELSDFFLKYAPDVRWRLVVEETLASNVLEASFDVMTSPISSEASRVSCDELNQ